MSRSFKLGLACAALVGASAVAFAAGEPPADAGSAATPPAPAAAAKAPDLNQRIVDVLFESRQLDLIDKGQQVTYRFTKKGNNEQMVGPNFEDDIRLEVTKVDDKNQRDVVVHVFSGKQARDPQAYPELTVNPLFQWYLTRGVITMSGLAGGSQMYYKGKFREALGTKAKIEDIEADYQGKKVKAHKISVTPFASDENSSKMEGFEGALFTMVVSEEVPGYLLDLGAKFESSKATGPSLEERMTLVGVGATK